MKLPAWMASGVTGFITATVQVGARPTVVLAPLSPFTVSEPASMAVTTPRTTIGPAGAWAQAAPAERVATAATAVIILNIVVLPRILSAPQNGPRNTNQAPSPIKPKPTRWLAVNRSPR